MRIAKTIAGTALLVGALLALAAPALAAEFNAETAWSGKGETPTIALTPGFPATCASVTLTGVSPKNALGLTALVKPKYETCFIGGVIAEPFELEAGECEYELGAKGTSTFTTEASIVNCSSGIKFKTNKLHCEVTIPEQTATEMGSWVNLKREAGSFESEADAGPIGFKYTASEICSSDGIKSGKGGAFKGAAIIDGIIAVGAEVSVVPTEVKFGNATKASRAVEYTNKGSVPWIAGSLVYTVKTGSGTAVETKNECAGVTLKTGEKCSVVVNYEVPAAESYKGELKLGNESATVIVKATT
jgi:hypothetical protein